MQADARREPSLNVLKSIEKHMEKMVEGIFGRAFKSSVQPVELAHKLAKEMSDHKTVSVSRIYVPNEYEVYLSPGDYEQLSSFEGPLVEDLASYLVAYANRESWTLVAPPAITLHADADLALGEFGIAAHMGAQGAPESAVALVGAPIGTVVKPPAGLSQTIVFQPPAGAAAKAGLTFPQALTALMVKRELPETLVAMGGIYPTANPERAMRDGNVDFAFVGEGERSLPQLLAFLKGAGVVDLGIPLLAMAVFSVVIFGLAVSQFSRTFGD